MNLSSLRVLAPLGWVPPGNDRARITLSRSGGLLRARVSQGVNPIIRWWADDGDDFSPRSVPTRALRAAPGAVADASVSATSGGLRFAGAGFVADVRATEEEPVESVPEGGAELAPADVARIAWVARAMASEDNRYGLSGWHVDERDGRPVVAATDGNRLNRAQVDALAGVTLPVKTIFPRAWWTVAARLAGRGGMRILLDGRVVWAVGDGWATRAKLNETDFPDYRQILSLSWGGEVRVDARVLADGLRKLAPLACTASYGVVTVTIADDGMTLLTRGDSDLGASVSVTVPAVATEWVRKGLNTSLLADALRGVDGEVVMREDGGTVAAPGQVTIEIPDGRRAIVMPTRLD